MAPTTPHRFSPEFELAAAYPTVARFYQVLSAHDWPAVRATYAPLDWTERSMLVDAAGRWPATQRFLTDRTASDPTDPLAATLRAGQLFRTGWQAGYAAVHLSTGLAADFVTYLNQAEQLLIELTARHPGDVVGWELRLRTAMGLRLGLAEARRRYDQGARCAPHHLPAQEQLLRMLGPNWDGDADRMHAFAWQCTLAAPEGALSGVLVAIGHLERWLAMAGGRDGTRYLRGDRVQQEIREAAARSVWHPRFQPRAGWVAAHNCFAAVLGLAGDHAAAAPHFRAVGRLASEVPWRYYFRVPEEMLHRLRRKALGRGGTG